jgi:GrpB-like predicted nucleotidyltransferase (UPF0157 family)
LPTVGDPVGPEEVALVDVRDVAAAACDVIARFERDFAETLAGVEVHHIGATSLPFGHTKGDVDVNLRVGGDAFPALLATLGGRLAEAQRENWTPTFASFSSTAYALPLGIQVTVIGSPDDFLLMLRDRLRTEPGLLRRYDEAKVAAAPGGREAYWSAKDALLRELLPERDAPGSSLGSG